MREIETDGAVADGALHDLRGELSLPGLVGGQYLPPTKAARRPARLKSLGTVATILADRQNPSANVGRSGTSDPRIRLIP